MKFSSVIKILLSLAMLWLVLQIIDFGQLKQTILSIPFSLAVLIVAAYIIGQTINTLKWWIIANSSGIDVKYTTCLKAGFLGMYVNCFGLGMVGGDLVRGLLISEGKAIKAKAISSVIADRIQGMAVLAGIGLISTIIFGATSLSWSLIDIMIAVGVGVAIFWLSAPKILNFLGTRGYLPQKIVELGQVFPQTPKVLFAIISVSAVFHLWQIGMHWLMAYGMGISAPLSVFLISIPFVNLLSNLPISWNGLGVRENAYVFFLYPAILSREQAIAFGAIWLLAVTVSSAIGGVISFITEDFSVYVKRSSAAVDSSPAAINSKHTA